MERRLIITTQKLFIINSGVKFLIKKNKQETPDNYSFEIEIFRYYLLPKLALRPMKLRNFL